MKIIFTRFIPFGKIAAINFFGLLIAPRGTKITARLINHEAIHTAQMKEMFYIFFYLWYLIEWLIRLFGRGSAYRNISFEKEAYLHDSDPRYLKRRKHGSWIRYL